MCLKKNYHHHHHHLFLETEFIVFILVIIVIKIFIITNLSIYIYLKVELQRLMLLHSCWATSVSHRQPILNIFSLLLNYFLLINLPLYNYTFSNIYLLLPFYLPLLYTLTLQFLYPFIFHLFWPFFSPFFYYKNLLFSLPFNPYFAHTKRLSF